MSEEQLVFHGCRAACYDREAIWDRPGAGCALILFLANHDSMQLAQDGGSG